MDKPEMSEGVTEDKFFSADDDDAASFQTARLSISSLSSCSESYPPSLTNTPLDGRAIGRDIEERPSFSSLPFTYEEFYGQPHPTGRCHLPTCNCSTTRVELHAPATNLRADNVVARRGDFSNPPVQPPKMRIVFKIDTHTERAKTAMWIFTKVKGSTDRARTAMRIVCKDGTGVFSCYVDPSHSMMTVTGVHIDVVHLVKALRKKRLLTELVSVQLEVVEQQSQQ